MATTMSSGNLISVPASPAALNPAVAAALKPRRRNLSREAGQALEILGHAIEYLADEFALECMSRQANISPGLHPRVVAIEMLKAKNREIYLSCPVVPTLGDRLRSLLRL